MEEQDAKALAKEAKKARREEEKEQAREEKRKAKGENRLFSVTNPDYSRIYQTYRELLVDCKCTWMYYHMRRSRLEKETRLDPKITNPSYTCYHRQQKSSVECKVTRCSIVFSPLCQSSCLLRVLHVQVLQILSVYLAAAVFGYPLKS